jgi:hypothetical protein
MIRMTKFAGLSVAAFGLSLVLAGCGGPDNEKTGNLNTDGTPTKIEPGAGPAPKTSTEAYDAMQKNQVNPATAKGYPKK